MQQSDNVLPIGRPSQLAETLELAKKYIYEGEWRTAGVDSGKPENVIPSIAGLSCYVGKSRRNIYEYGEKSEDFKRILDAILSLQEHLALNGGMDGRFNATIVKLLLGKHGYHDKAEIDTISSDGSMTIKHPVYKIVHE